MRLGIEFNHDGKKAWIVDLDHNDVPHLLEVCFDKSDYPNKQLEFIAKNIVKVFNATKQFANVL